MPSPLIAETPNHNPHKNVYKLNDVNNNVSIDLPVVINLNPRSLYGKECELATLIEQYNCDICCISESWERPDHHLGDILNIDNFVLSQTHHKNME